MGIDFVLPRFVTNQESFSCVEKLLGIQTLKRNTKRIVENLNMSGPNIWWAVQILFDFILEMKEMGTIDLLESLKNNNQIDEIKNEWQEN